MLSANKQNFDQEFLETDTVRIDCMRKTNLKFLTYLTITVGALGALATSVQAQPLNTIFSHTNQAWQYYQNGNTPANNNGVDWKATTYNDTAAPWEGPGRGLLAYETATGDIAFYNGSGAPINTPLNRTVGGVPGGTTNITYYFRTHFNFPTNPLNAILYFTNLIDDGCVVYLNGFEIYRYRISQAVPTYANYASGGPPAEGRPEFLSIFNSPRLRQGDNVLAVELHDGGLGSSDVAWTCGVAYRTMTPIVITQQPPSSVEIVVGDDLVIPIGVFNAEPRYWWFRNNVFLQNQTNAQLLISDVVTNHSGTYHCVVSNAISGARSTDSIVRVVPDTFGPELRGVVLEEGATNRIIALFNEDIQRINNLNPSLSSTNVDNYSLKEVVSGIEVPIRSAVAGSGLRTVRIDLGTNVDCSKEYVLKISNITDLRFNLIEPNSVAILACVQKTNVVDFNVNWRFFYSAESPASQRVPQNWMATNFVEPDWWGDSSAPFYQAQGCTNTCFGGIGNNCPQGTQIDIGYPTYVFRTKFVISSNTPTTGLLRFAHVIDDGAIFYLNGQELGRYRIPAGTINHDYLVPECIEGGCATNQFTVTNMIVGTNVVAVELHNCPQFVGADVIMGTQVDYIYTNMITVPTIDIRRLANPRRVALTWNSRGWRLETSTNLNLGDAGWTNVANVTTNMLGHTNNTPNDRPQRFYRLRRPARTP
jgi:hypothetical protein